MTLEREILEELKKIRGAVTPKPMRSPPTGLWAEFMDFLRTAGVLGVAIGFIMGLYVNKVVSAFVADIIMPIPSAFIHEGDLKGAVVTIPVGRGVKLAVGDFAGVVIDFLIVAGVVFLVAKYGRKMVPK